MKFFRHIQPWVVFPSLILLLGSVVFSLVSESAFVERLNDISDWILNRFDWLFSWSSFIFLIICVIVYFSPIGRKRIGGKEAVPILSKWRWFTITLCTTIATGILFWGTAEPIFHYNAPPEGLGIAAGSDDAAAFAMSSMFMHWTFTPYGIYTVAALAFALCYYNLKQPFSLGAVLYPLSGSKTYGFWSTLINNVCIFALIAGMSASLGAGVLTLSGGLHSLFGINQSDWLNLAICLLIVLVFILSASSGLQRGIRVLSDYNIKAFLLLAGFVLLTGPVSDMIRLGWAGAGEYLQTFFIRSTGIGSGIESAWDHSWTAFYWANWMAWAPVTALFLGKIAKGYTVREFIRVNLLYTSLFGALWMIIFSGSALSIEHESGALSTILNSGTDGSGRIVFGVLKELPAALIISGIFLLIAFLSYVTAADSNTSALGGISSKGVSADHDTASTGIKVMWGSVIGLVAFVMITFAGLDGIKVISTIGGLPAMFLLIVISVSLLYLAFGKRLK